VFTALANSNTNAGGSYVEHGSELYVVRGLGFVRSIADIEAIAVDTRGGTPVKISDIGQVVIGNACAWGASAAPTPGSPATLPGSATRTMWRRDRDHAPRRESRRGVPARQAMADLINAHYLPPGVRLVTYYDRTALVERSLHTVKHNVIAGIVLVLLVLILFLGLGNYRSALVVALTVPVALLGAFMLLDLKGIPANLISLGAIDFGIIVDSAVVVIENILRLLEQRKGQFRSLTRSSPRRQHRWAGRSSSRRPYC